MNAQLLLLNPPVIDIGPFNTIVAKSTVSDVDAKRISPIGKFAELVNEALLDGDWAYRHLYLTFYFRIPYMIHGELSQFTGQLNITASSDNFQATGLLSMTFETAKAFLVWATHSDRSQWLRAFANGMYATLRQYAYFQMPSTDLADRTFMLRG